MSVTKSTYLDAANTQLHVLRCAFSSAGGTTVIELVKGTHLPASGQLLQVHGYNVSGSCSNYQLDVHEAASGLSSIPAGAAKLFEGTSTAKASQSNTAKIGANIGLDTGRSLYVRLQPDSGTDNAATVDVYVSPKIGAV
jgi:hypothetical protein